ncbi:MAG: hypothetical protein J0H31_16215, partial [Alphaproteobacteria bacterium]|nr:hypothetical protein [Alphaproteobacteria bacterium]
MATKLNIVLGIAEAQSHEAGMKPVMSDDLVDVETLDVSTDSEQSTVASDGADQVWMLTALGGNAWIAFGRNPTAVVGDCIPLMAGVPYTFSASPRLQGGGDLGMIRLGLGLGLVATAISTGVVAPPTQVLLTSSSRIVAVGDSNTQYGTSLNTSLAYTNNSDLPVLASLDGNYNEDIFAQG